MYWRASHEFVILVVVLKLSRSWMLNFTTERWWVCNLINTSINLTMITYVCRWKPCIIYLKNIEPLFASGNPVVLWEKNHRNEIVFLTASGQHFRNDNWEALVEISWNLKAIRFLNRVTSIQHTPPIERIVTMQFSMLYWVFSCQRQTLVINKYF